MRTWCRSPPGRFVVDSPLEEAGFELSVPPERRAFPKALDRFRRPSLRAPWEWDVKRRLRGVEFPVALFDAADALVPGNGGADMIWASALACSGDFLLRLTACQGKDLISVSCACRQLEGPARVAQCPHERRSGARGRCLFAHRGKAGVALSSGFLNSLRPTGSWFFPRSARYERAATWRREASTAMVSISASYQIALLDSSAAVACLAQDGDGHPRTYQHQ
jgi:hypothetical protein